MLPRFLNRRDLFKSASAVALWEGLGLKPRAQAELQIGPGIFESIGVTPIINCKGTFTIVSGSQSLPEVKAAMMEASKHYVHLDELMDRVGARLAQLTGAEWGMVSNGCASALAHATAACVAGADPEKMQRLPDTRGLKNEVIAPMYSRNVYDHAVRLTGAHFVDVDSVEAYQRAFTPRTAMVMVLASPPDRGPLGLHVLSAIAKERGVPVLVDAAAERLTVPNVHLQRGATLVAYSGGKCLRGPQAAGLLLGRKDLIQAAWLHSAPHHALGRPMKAAKEEIMGMLAAVEAWLKRDHKAEWGQWESWLSAISQAVTKVNGVTTQVIEPEGLSNNSPRMVINWDGEQLGVSGQDIERAAYTGTPRIILAGSGGSSRMGAKNSSITIMPYMMMPGDAEKAGARLHELLANPTRSAPVSKAAPAGNVTGQWEAELEFLLGKARHSLVFEQKDADLMGTHRGEFLSSDLRGIVNGDEVWFRSSHRYEGTRLGYEFIGKLDGDSITGEVDLGEYGKARFTARRHQYGRPGGPMRPRKNV